MDLSWIIYVLIFLVVACAAFAVIKYLIMPVVPAAVQPFVWAVIGILLLIGLLVLIGASTGSLHIGHMH
jgi:hypothetical protein